MSNTRPIPSEDIRACRAIFVNIDVDSPWIQFHRNAFPREGIRARFLQDVACCIHVRVNVHSLLADIQPALDPLPAERHVGMPVRFFSCCFPIRYRVAIEKTRLTRERLHHLNDLDPVHLGLVPYHRHELEDWQLPEFLVESFPAGQPVLLEWIVLALSACRCAISLLY